MAQIFSRISSGESCLLQQNTMSFRGTKDIYIRGFAQCRPIRDFDNCRMGLRSAIRLRPGENAAAVERSRLTSSSIPGAPWRHTRRPSFLPYSGSEEGAEKCRGYLFLGRERGVTFGFRVAPLMGRKGAVWYIAWRHKCWIKGKNDSSSLSSTVLRCLTLEWDASPLWSGNYLE